MSPQPDTRLADLLRSLSSAFGAVVAFVGCLVLAGWALDIAALKFVFIGLVSMKPNTAIAFILAGLSLWLHQTGRASSWSRFAAQACAGLVIVLGLLNLGEYLFDRDFGIDQLLFEDPQLDPVPPGRMAIATAIDFVILGLALLLMAAGTRRYLLVEVLGLPPIAFSILVLLVYAFGVESLYIIGPHFAQALHTAILFIPLSAGILFAYPDRGLMATVTSDSAGGFMLRRLLVSAIVVPFLLGWLVLLGETRRLYDAPFGLALFAMSIMIVFTIMISLSSSSLHRIDMQRRHAMEEQARLTEVAQHRAAELEVSNRELQSFAYSVAHDLRAPLRHINSFSQLLIKEYADRLDDRGKEYLKFLCNASQRMGQLIDDLLKLSRVTRAEMLRQPINLSQIASSVAGQLLKKQPNRQVELIIAPNVTAIGDPQLLRTLLESLLDNAWKFTSPRPVARIEFGVARQDDKPVYFVRDNGVGFDMAYVGKIFGAFQRLHRAEEFPGTGIGLAIVQRIVHRHGGQVWAEGALDRGATFYFTLE